MPLFYETPTPGFILPPPSCLRTIFSRIKSCDSTVCSQASDGSQNPSIGPPRLYTIEPGAPIPPKSTPTAPPSAHITALGGPSTPPSATRVSSSGPEPCPSGSPLAVDIISLLRAPLRHRSDGVQIVLHCLTKILVDCMGNFRPPRKTGQNVQKSAPPVLYPQNRGIPPKRGLHRSDVQTTPTTSKL